MLIDDHIQIIKMKSVKINGFQQGLLFNFEIIQSFFHIEKDQKEVGYTFSNDFKMCIYDITFILGDKIFKPKLQARQEIEMVDQTNINKMIQIKLGNLQPDTECNVILKLAFVGQIINGNSFFVKFPIDFYTSSKSFGYFDVDASNFYFQLQLNKYKISKLRSNVKNFNFNKTTNLFLIQNKIESDDNEHSIIIEFEIEDQITSVAFLEDQMNYNCCALMISPNLPFLINEKNSEFVFVIDCSGSISNESIEKVSECLIYFIKSLPPNSYFNFVRFGSRHEKLFEKSVVYNDENVEKAINFALKLRADLCGTDFYSVLEDIFKDECQYGQRQIFIITDGIINNKIEDEVAVKQVLDLVSSNSNKNRCFTICIGPSKSDFVEKIAQISGGKSDFVQEGESINEKIIQQLQSSFYPLLTSIEIHIKNENKDDLFEISPNLIHSINANESAIIFLCEKKTNNDENVFDKGISVTGLYMKKQIELPIEKVEKFVSVEEDEYGCSKGQNIGKCIFPLFAFQLLQRLERKISNEDKLKAIELSLLSGVLCKYTEFAGMIGNIINQIDNEIIMNILKEDRQMIDHVNENLNFYTPNEKVQKKSWFENFFGFLFKKTNTQNENSPTNNELELKNNVYDLVTIIRYQKAEGFWEDLIAVQKMTGIKIENIEEINIGDKKIKNNCIATIIAIASIRIKSASEKRSWILIENKAFSWLKRILGNNFDVEDVISKIK